MRLDYTSDLWWKNAVVYCLDVETYKDTDGDDIGDYYGVDPRLGTLGDFVELVRTAGDRGIRLILDLVVNHTSDQHPWFAESRSSRDNPRRDWYWWREEPNNWRSVFSGPAWELD